MDVRGHCRRGEDRVTAQCWPPPPIHFERPMTAMSGFFSMGSGPHWAGQCCLWSLGESVGAGETAAAGCWPSTSLSFICPSQVQVHNRPSAFCPPSSPVQLPWVQRAMEYTCFSEAGSDPFVKCLPKVTRHQKAYLGLKLP